ncbi:MAG TPA: hypothetical protein VFS08_07595 [Gemmatimonadaceae bacterium]|nr:hypothetical protein [Gemmatimonadaceae bacterium]
MTLTAIGDSARLSATIRNRNGGTVALPVTWSSSAPAVATVREGVVQAMGNGTALITVRVGSSADTTTVTVRQQPARLIFLAQPGAQLQGRPMPALEVAAEDARGVRLTASTDPVVLSLSAGTLGGTTARPLSSDGVATFTDLTIAEPSRGVRLVARMGEVSAASAFFGVDLALVSVSAGGVHTCGLTAAGVAYCWGYAGRTGDGSTTTQAAPVRVSGAERYRLVDAGSATTSALTTSGQLVSWASAPAPLATSVALDTLVAGWHACGLAADRRAYCWGTVPSYFAGDTTQMTNAEAPMLALGGREMFAVATGIAFTCGLAVADSTAWCTGNNDHGVLGDGTTAFAMAPVAVAGGLKFVAIDAGNEFTCGLAVSGETYCWGRNDEGQLGDPALSVAHSALPVLVSGGHRFRTLTLGAAHACGLEADGTAVCWGRNFYGILGNPDVTAPWSATPVGVSGNLHWAVLSAGGFHTCGIATTGYTYCWGDFLNRATGTEAPAWEGPARILSPTA